METWQSQVGWQHTTQRGYQAASKIITTVDTMLDTLLNTKR